MNKVEIIGTNESLYIEHLNNGLDIYMVPNDKIKNFYITINNKYGSIHNDFKYDGKIYNLPNGVAHYLEHSVFNMPDGSAFDYYSKLGSSANAYTSFDLTCYEVFSNNKFKENLRYLLKCVFTPYFNQDVFNKEKGIICEEVKMYKDDPDMTLLNKILESVYVQDKRRFLISGTEDDVKSIKLDDVVKSYEAFYNPENMYVIITGNFNPEEAIAIISEEMSKYKFNDFSKTVVKDVNEPFKVKEEDTVISLNVDKPKVALGVKIPKSNFKQLKLSKFYQKLYLSFILAVNFGYTSLLNEELIDSSIINEEIYRMILETEDYYTVLFFANTEYPDYLIKKIKETFDNLIITSDDLNRKIKASISNIILMFDSIDAVNSSISEDILNYGKCLNDTISLYKGLNVDIAKKYITKLDKKLYTVVKIIPNEEKEN